ncbi:MAG: CBS domain-containing protein [Planctomycetaceae bacterium]|nr:CBS domain-containing protein [Planctomycetaceae bacterium]
MTASETETKSKTIELATNAFEAFCDDISGMFGIEMKCVTTGIFTETTKGLSQKYKKLSAVTLVKTEGILNGTFHTVFDQAGMFALAGIIIMLPKQKVLDDMKRGTPKEAEAIADTIKETGNLLVGSWDRVFREELEGHGHFLQAGTFIGNPWDKPQGKIGLPDTEQFQYVSFQMTVADYPPFNCGVFYPEAIFIRPPEPVVEEKPAEAVNAETAPASEVKEVPTAETPKPAEPQPEAKEAPKTETTAEAKPAQVVEAKEPVPTPEATAATLAPAEVKPAETPKQPVADVPAEKSIESKQQPTGPVSETIQKMVESSPQIKDGLASLQLCAKDIMQKEVLFGNPDDSVQDALAKMQQTETSYMLIGRDNLPEGIVSTYDVASAVSVYLKPVFAKWRRPADDATLQIKVKWIMTRSVHTIKPEASIAAVMEIMCQTGLRCLPVAGAGGKVEGLITAFDIFKALLKTDTNISSAGKPLQAAAIV